MTCREFTDFISDYLAGELPSGVRAQFERHLDLCANCRAYLTSYERTVTLGKAAFLDPTADVDGTVPEDLVRAILAARGPRPA